MNILVPHTWLLEHLETKAEPTDIQRLLSLSGPSVERIYDREGEAVYDIEVTTNRVDCMSIRGIAREAAVILNENGFASKLKPLQAIKLPKVKKTKQLPKIKNRPELCQRVMCVLLTDVERAETPEWMAKRLRQIEINVYDAVIDITNYITHDLGHPCHAFDYDKLMKLGGEIHVTEANAGKSFTTLDGEQYQTVGGEVVFENQSGEIIDLPGIKGTANTSIDDNTRNVLLWIESCSPKKIRFASMTHAIRTVAAQLNEKNVDPNLADSVLLSGISLYQELCQATVASEIHDEFVSPSKIATISVSEETIETYLGFHISPDKISNILEKLGCSVDNSKKTFSIQPPTYRPDLSIPADIVEEVARIYGYHRLPSVIMPTPIPLTKPQGYDFQLEHRVKQFLADVGWQEVYTYSMVSQELAEKSGYKLDGHLKLQNPLTDDRVFLRRSLIPSLEEVIDQNSQETTLSVFEIAHTYEPQNQKLPLEKLFLTMVSSKPFREVKGDLEALLNQFFIQDLTVESLTSTSTLFKQVGALQSQDVRLGEIGLLPSGNTAVTIDMSALLEQTAKHPTYVPLPKTASIIEDMTFELPIKTEVGPVLQTLATGSNIVESVTLRELYQQNATFRITYHDSSRNLSKSDVEPVRKNLVDLLHEHHQTQLIGQV